MLFGGSVVIHHEEGYGKVLQVHRYNWVIWAIDLTIDLDRSNQKRPILAVAGPSSQFKAECRQQQAGTHLVRLWTAGSLDGPKSFPGESSRIFEAFGFVQRLPFRQPAPISKPDIGSHAWGFLRARERKKIL